MFGEILDNIAVNERLVQRERLLPNVDHNGKEEFKAENGFSIPNSFLLDQSCDHGKQKYEVPKQEKSVKSNFHRKKMDKWFTIVMCFSMILVILLMFFIRNTEIFPSLLHQLYTQNKSAH